MVPFYLEIIKMERILKFTVDKSCFECRTSH